MKKVFGILALCLILTLAGTAFSGCGLFGDSTPTIEVSTAEELRGAEGANVILKNDLDLEGGIFEPVSVASFDGGGHTISNAVIVASGSKEHASFFSRVKSGVRNVTFENISVSSEGTSYAAIVWDGVDRGDSKQDERVGFENVHVKNCTLDVLQKTNEEVGYFGGLAGICGGDSFVGCTINNLTAEVAGYDPAQDGTYVIGPDLYVGGFAGSANHLTNCSVSGSRITVSSKQRYSEPYVGGLVGYFGKSRECL